MNNVIKVWSEAPVSRSVNDSLHAMDGAIVAAIKSAKDAGVPQGLVVSVLSAHAMQETIRLIDIRRALEGGDGGDEGGSE